MKKTAENRYPHSATLFRFCKEALEIRYDGNVKVIDQDVGAILGYDPADCSHWKKGKKNIRALGTLRSIADHLNIDERLLIDVTSGKIDLNEAVFEFKGYGNFSFLTQHLENLKKEFFKDPGKWSNERSRPFEELFDVDRSHVAQCAQEVLKLGNFSEAPIYIPELYQLFQNLNIEARDDLNQGFAVSSEGAGSEHKMKVSYQGSEMRPYIRFLAAKQLFLFMCESGHEITRSFKEVPDEVLEVQSNLFAGMLLVPGSLLRKEVETIDSSVDIVAQLSEIFWVSKALMNQRLRDYMEFLS